PPREWRQHSQHRTIVAVEWMVWVNAGLPHERSRLAVVHEGQLLRGGREMNASHGEPSGSQPTRALDEDGVGLIVVRQERQVTGAAHRPPQQLANAAQGGSVRS